jgi:MFS family permease
LIGDGFRVMFASERLRAVSALNFALGVCYMGVFLVAIPLLVRDVYNGTQSDIALTSMANTGGTIIATATLLTVGAVRLKGRVLLISLLVSACAIALMGARLPFGVLLGVITVSGIAGGVGLIMGRTLALENAPHTHRSRVMAIYMLAIMGGAPLGSLLTGFAATHLGAHGTLMAAAAAIGLTVLITATGSRLASA